MNLEDLRSELSGMLTGPNDPDWDSARGCWNLSVDQRPVAVVAAAGTEDVQAAVRFAAQNGLRVAPQSTGHGAEPLPSLEGALLLKTSAMRQVRLDGDIAIAGAGAVAGDVAGLAEGRAAALGFAPTVGATGLCLSGGVGWLSRTHGLACNNVVGMDVVLANGEPARVDQQSNHDLFWALRGGGSRCAVVTSIELKTHEVPEASGGALMWPADRIDWVLEQFLALTQAPPQSLSLVFRYLSVPDVEGPPPPLRGRKFAAIIAVNFGSAEESDELIAPLRGSDAPEIDTFAPISPAQLVRIAGDPEAPVPARGMGFLFDHLDQEALRAVAAAIAAAPLTVAEIRHLGGALAQAPADAGALSAISSPYSFFAGGAGPTPELRSAVDAALAGIRDRLDPWASSTALMSSGPTGTHPSECFDNDTWERLRSLDQAHDPARLILSNRAA